ncbi:putative inner membrane protein [Priestia megaterium]|uniref:DUF1819 family protein n=1 Tax=Priestia megaterium TaxID=1404 RepID=UPI0039E1A4E0
MKRVYSAGYTAEHLYRNEMKLILDLQLQGLSKQEIKEQVVEGNIFQCRSEAAIKDLFPRVYKRTLFLDEYLKQVILSGSRSDQNALLLYSFLKCFKLPSDFFLEVIHYNFNNFKTTITDGTIHAFFEEKEQQYEQVKGWSGQTKYKLKQVMLKILIEAEILERNEAGYFIKPLSLSRELSEYIELHQEYKDLLVYTLNN